MRLPVLAGAAAGLALAALVAVSEACPPALALPAAATAFVAARHCRQLAARRILAALAAALLGIVIGAARLRAIDEGALQATPGARVSVLGRVDAVPRRADGEVRVALQTEEGKLLATAREPVADLAIGAMVRTSGVLSNPPPWQVRTLRRQGIAMLLRARRIHPTGGRRGGLLGRLDVIRDRAATALGAGIPSREAGLARGFVLGQDDRIDARTVDDFRRSGLSHLLAVSGQNVMLLILLASPVLAALGIPLRARLLWLLGLIAVYVPLAGAGPSIQRAGAMGGAGVFALLAGRPASRAFAVLLATDATLLLNPRVCGDPGWQLSFAAVLGIFLAGAPIRDAILARLGAGPLQRGIAEGGALTISATLATLPLICHHFGALPVGTLAANLIALPAVAPAMWLGMIVAALGQVPGAPVEVLNWVNARLLAYVAEVAARLGRPGWAVLELRLDGPTEVAAAYLTLASAAAVALRLEASRRAVRRRRQRVGPRGRGPALAIAGAAILAGLITMAPSFVGDEHGRAEPVDSGLRVEVLDVGQGDAILLQPAHAGAVLVDGGPPGDELRKKLRSAGVDRLAAAVVTHDQSDHAGGIREILGDLPIRRLVFSSVHRRLLAEARLTGTTPYRVSEGSEISSGRLRLEVLWPPPAPAAEGDPNARSIVLLVRWGRFEMLLTGDAEAEAVPMDPGPIDVLKVSHHGSEDSGLGPLLERAVPGLAVISVGEGNPFGHPTAATLATLAEHGVPVLRTDRDGTISISADEGEFLAETER